jgi:hypothetical protein
MMKKTFTNDDVIAGRHLADLGEYGDFSADYVVVNPVHMTVHAVGTLVTMPRHLDEPVAIPASIDIYLESPADVVGMTASDLFSAPWESWTCDDIPEGWEY